jgi:hypothetical protein
VRFINDIGYSIIGEYPKSFKRLMRATKKGDYRPIYKFAIRKNSTNEEYMPLYMSAALTLEEIEGERKSYILSYGKIRGITPVDFTSIDDFYVKKSTGMLFEKQRNMYKKISYQELFKRLERAHLSRITDIRAAWLRFRILVLRKLPSHILSLLAFISSVLTLAIEGKRFTYDVLEESLMEGYDTRRREESSAAPKEQIDFFGYKVSIWTLSTFSLLVVAISILSIYIKLPYYEVLVESPGPILTIAVAILGIVLYDKLTPYTLKKVIKKLQITAYNLKNKGIRLKI